MNFVKLQLLSMYQHIRMRFRTRPCKVCKKRIPLERNIEVCEDPNCMRIHYLGSVISKVRDKHVYYYD